MHAKPGPSTTTRPRESRPPNGAAARPLRPTTLSIVSERGPALPSPDVLVALLTAVATEGDRVAFAALFKHYAPRLKTYLLKAGTSTDLADDLVQDTMVAVWRRAAQFDPARAGVSTWIYTIARHLCIDGHRRRQAGGLSFVEMPEADDEPVDESPRPEERLHAAERESRVRAALGALTAEQAEVLRLSFFEEHAHARIAERLGIPLGTAKSRVRLALLRLRQILGEAP